MTVEYYVKRRENSKIIATCETPEQAMAALHRLPKATQDNYAVFYSKDAMTKYQKEHQL